MSFHDHNVGSSSSSSVEAEKLTSAIREVRCYSGTEFSTPQTEEERNICWICLESDTPTRHLEQPCKCPRYCHLRCLARWQLQSAGTRRESHCDFCNCRLPDWREALTPQSNIINAPAIMNVNFEGKTYSFEVKPGTSGYLQFTEAIRHAFHLPPDSELNITFTCDEPYNEDGSLLTLQGPGAYDAAVYCASVSAARRHIGHRRSHSASGIRAPNDEGGSEQGRPTRHQRSRTLDTTTPILRPDEYTSAARRSHTRTRSIPGFALGRSQRGDDVESEMSRRGWSRVVRKIRGLYQRLTHK